MASKGPYKVVQQDDGTRWGVYFGGVLLTHYPTEAESRADCNRSNSVHHAAALAMRERCAKVAATFDDHNYETCGAIAAAILELPLEGGEHGD